VFPLTYSLSAYYFTKKSTRNKDNNQKKNLISQLTMGIPDLSDQNIKSTLLADWEK